MAKAKKITSGVVHVIHEGVLHTFRAGDVVPDWAEITNPALFAGKAPEPADETPATPTTPRPPVKAGDTTSTSTESTPATKLPGIKELRAQAKELGLSAAGSKDDLAQRIAAKQAESAPAGDEKTDDDEDSDRAGLEARAKELGIDDFDENTTDDELVALIEDKE